MPDMWALEWRAAVEAAYSQPHRHYHTLAHLRYVFGEGQRFAPLAPAVEWAIWFHDFVYDPRSATNEEDSAGVAREALGEMRVDAATIERTAELILATKHTAGTAIDGDDARLLVSLDLAILAAPDAEYDRYAAGVRAEYAHVPDAAFRAGRAAFLEKMLAQAVLFPHPGFVEYEPRARANMARELGALESALRAKMPALPASPHPPESH